MSLRFFIVLEWLLYQRGFYQRDVYIKKVFVLEKLTSYGNIHIGEVIVLVRCLYLSVSVLERCFVIRVCV